MATGPAAVQLHLNAAGTARNVPAGQSTEHSASELAAGLSAGLTVRNQPLAPGRKADTRAAPAHLLSPEGSAGRAKHWDVLASTCPAGAASAVSASVWLPCKHRGQPAAAHAQRMATPPMMSNLPAFRVSPLCPSANACSQGLCWQWQQRQATQRGTALHAAACLHDPGG